MKGPRDQVDTLIGHARRDSRIRLLVAFFAGVGAAALIAGGIGLTFAISARADCTEAQREFSAWRAENPSVPLEAGTVPSCASQDAAMQLAMGTAYTGAVAGALAAGAFAWTRRTTAASA